MLNLDYTHFAHTCMCFDTIIPTTKWRGQTTPGCKIPYVIHFPHKWSRFTLELFPFGIQNMHCTLLKLATVAPPTCGVWWGDGGVVLVPAAFSQSGYSADSRQTSDGLHNVLVHKSSWIRCRCELAQPDDIMLFQKWILLCPNTVKQQFGTTKPWLKLFSVQNYRVLLHLDGLNVWENPETKRFMMTFTHSDIPKWPWSSANQPDTCSSCWVSLRPCH